MNLKKFLRHLEHKENIKKIITNAVKTRKKIVVDYTIGRRFFCAAGYASELKLKFNKGKILIGSRIVDIESIYSANPLIDELI